MANNFAKYDDINSAISALYNNLYKNIESLKSTANATSAKTFEYNEKQAQAERLYNSKEAKLARDWEERMSNTSHQREVTDLKKAGLNPVLSVNSGANSYTTSSASSGAASATVADPTNAISSMLSSALGNMSSLMGSMLNYSASSNSAKATKYAADKSYKATKYRADVDYKMNANTNSSNRTIANINSEASRYNADVNYRIAMDKPATNLINVIDKYVGSGAKEVIDKVETDVRNYSKNNSLPTKTVDARLSKLNIPLTDQNRAIYRRATKLHNKKSMDKLASLIKKYKRK